MQHTQKKYWKMTHSCEKSWSLLCDSKNSAMWQKKTKSLDNARSKKIPARKTTAKPPIQQERTKTQNCTKVADTTKK